MLGMRSGRASRVGPQWSLPWRCSEDGGSGGVCTGSDTAVPRRAGLPPPGYTAGNAVRPLRELSHPRFAPAPLSGAHCPGHGREEEREGRAGGRQGGVCPPHVWEGRAWGLPEGRSAPALAAERAPPLAAPLRRRRREPCPGRVSGSHLRRPSSGQGGRGAGGNAAVGASRRLGRGGEGSSVPAPARLVGPEGR